MQYDTSGVLSLWLSVFLATEISQHVLISTVSLTVEAIGYQSVIFFPNCCISVAIQQKGVKRQPTTKRREKKHKRKFKSNPFSYLKISDVEDVAAAH